MKFSESYIGQPVFLTNNPDKIGYIHRISCIHDGIENIYVLVDRGDVKFEYGLNELTPAKGNM